MNNVAVLIIRIYQKFISPHKGFSCAHANLFNGASCSEEIINIINSKGIIQGHDKIKLRFEECRNAYLILSSKDKDKKMKNRKTSTWLDCCDCSSSCDVAECFSGSKHCDLPDLPCDCSIF